MYIRKNQLSSLHFITIVSFCLLAHLLIVSLHPDSTFAWSAHEENNFTHYHTDIGSGTYGGMSVTWTRCANPAIGDVGILMQDTETYECPHAHQTYTDTSNEILMTWVSMIPYAHPTDVTGGDLSAYIREGDASGTVMFQLGFVKGGNFTPFGGEDLFIPHGTRKTFTVDMSRISGQAPSGSHLALRQINVSALANRTYFGTGNDPKGSIRFEVNEREILPDTPDPLSESSDPQNSVLIIRASSETQEETGASIDVDGIFSHQPSAANSSGTEKSSESDDVLSADSTASSMISYAASSADVPSLSFPAFPHDDGLDPNYGNTTTDFTYKVMYTDYQNDPPAAGYPLLFIGDDDGYHAYSMNEEDPLDTNFADGKTYFFTTGWGAAKHLRYYFEAMASTGDTSVIGLPTVAPGYKPGPEVYFLPGYNYVGVPKDVSTATVLCSDVFNTTGYLYCGKWDSLGLDPTAGQWLDHSYGNLDSGHGYIIWAVDSTRRVNELSLTDNVIPSTDINLDENGGWTLIANPYNKHIHLRDVVVVRNSTEYSYSQAVANGWISNSIYEWEGDGPGFAFKAFNDTPPAVLKPWVGYFIYAYDTTPTILRINTP